MNVLTAAVTQHSCRRLYCQAISVPILQMQPDSWASRMHMSVNEVAGINAVRMWVQPANPATRTNAGKALSAAGGDLVNQTLDLILTPAVPKYEVCVLNPVQTKFEHMLLLRWIGVCCSHHLAYAHCDL